MERSQEEAAPEGTLVEASRDATNRAQLVARIASRFMSLSPEQFDTGIEEALRAVGEFSGVDRSYAFRVDAATGISNTHEWCAPGIEPELHNLQGIPADSHPWFMAQMRRGEVVHVPRVRDLPPAAAPERVEWEREGIRSLICVPLESAGELVGFLGFDAVRREHRWSERDVELLRSVGGMVVSALDLKRSRRDLIESRTHLDQAQEAADIGLWTWDIARDAVTLSENAYRIYGIDPATFEGTMEANLRAFHPEDIPRAEQKIARSLRNKRGYPIEFRVRRQDGERLIHCESQLSLDAEGHPERIVGMIQDITDRRAAEEEQLRLSTAIEQVADAVMIMDDDGVIQFVNPAFESATGHHHAQVVGKDRRFLHHERQDPDIYRAIADTVHRGEVWSGRVLVRRRDGTAVLMDTTVSPVHDRNGAIVNHVAVQRDVTREAEIEEQLRQVQKMEAVGMLAGGIAHDFNNLLIAIIGHSDLLLMRRGDDTELCRHVHEIRKAGDRAKALTTQLLAFSRKQVLRPRALDLGIVLRDLGDLLQRVIGEDIELAVEQPDTATVIMADPGQMEQVVMNLATNARDAMAAGGRLRIGIEPLIPTSDHDPRLDGLETRPYAVLTVTDTGMGMDEPTLDRIFEPFFTTKAMGKGTGLGLATVYGIVRQTGGTIRVESAVGEGASFRVFLPTIDAAPDEARSPATLHAATEGDEVVLVVEDDTSVAAIVRSTLRSHGYKVIYAENGRHALEVVETFGGPIDLLFTDVVMPEMGGVQLAAVMTARNPDLRVLFSSGYTNSALLERGSLVEGVELLQKPYSPATLVQRVRETLDAPVRRA